MIRRLIRAPSALRRFIVSEASGGYVLIGVTALALVSANSSLATSYFLLVEASLGGLRVETFVNDGLMAGFFLLIGLEIKREFLHGQLRTWSSRSLPLIGAIGGMAVPALIFAGLNWREPQALRGWAIPSATDIAFALGILSLLGDRVPASLKVFLTTLAVLDDLGAVAIIALFYTGGLSLPLLVLVAVTLAGLVGLNWVGVRTLWPYLLLGAVLWMLVWHSGVHATVAGVLLAMTIPADTPSTAPERGGSPLHRLEHALEPWAAYVILPTFAFINAGVSIGADWLKVALSPIALGAGLGLWLGKQAGILVSIRLAVKLKFGQRPQGATWAQAYGMCLLCGIGFTMSLFIGSLAYPGSPEQMHATKMGVLIGSLLSAMSGAVVLLFASRRQTGHAP